MRTNYKNENNYNVIKFIYFCYNYDRDMLREAFNAVEGCTKDWFWDRFLGYCKEGKAPEKAIMDTITTMSCHNQESVIGYILANYKGI